MHARRRFTASPQGAALGMPHHCIWVLNPLSAALPSDAVFYAKPLLTALLPSTHGPRGGRPR